MVARLTDVFDKCGLGPRLLWSTANMGGIVDDLAQGGTIRRSCPIGSNGNRAANWAADGWMPYCRPALCGRWRTGPRWALQTLLLRMSRGAQAKSARHDFGLQPVTMTDLVKADRRLGLLFQGIAPHVYRQYPCDHAAPLRCATRNAWRAEHGRHDGGAVSTPATIEPARASV